MIELTEGLEWAVIVNGKYVGNAKTAAEWQSTINEGIKSKIISPSDLAYPNVVRYLPVEIGEKPVLEVKDTPPIKKAHSRLKTTSVAKQKTTPRKKKVKE